MLLTASRRDTRDAMVPPTLFRLRQGGRNVLFFQRGGIAAALKEIFYGGGLEWQKEQL
jgi:hypothetical protein